VEKRKVLSLRNGVAHRVLRVLKGLKMEGASVNGGSRGFDRRRIVYRWFLRSTVREEEYWEVTLIGVV